MIAGPTLQALAKAAASRFGDRICLSGGGRRWSFAAFDALCDRVASALATHHPSGSRVALFMANRPEYLILHCAIERAGLVRVPVNMRSPAADVRHIIEDTGARLILHDRSTTGIVAELQDSGPAPEAVDVENPAAWDALATHPPLPDLLNRAGLNDLCSINYTSGSSGRPKGIMLTHGNWLAVCRNMLIDRDIRGSDIVGHIGPLSHASGSYFLPWFLRGGHSVVVPGGTVDGLLDAIEQDRITVFTCVPTVLTRIVNHPGMAGRDLTSLRAIGYGAEPIPQNTLQRALDLFGPILTQNYGQSEAYMTITFLSPDDHFEPAADGGRGAVRIGCIGRPYSCVLVALRNEDGSIVEPGQSGEITVRSDHVMAGYWKLPAETARTLRDGWLWTGDLARADEDARLYLVGRRKEMLISGGFNIYPQEIEAVLTAHDGATDAAVVAVPDADWGEIAVAFVAPVPGRVVEIAELARHCKALLGYRSPKRFILIDELPRNSAGKIDKRALKAGFLGDGMQGESAVHA